MNDDVLKNEYDNKYNEWVELMVTRLQEEQQSQKRLYDYRLRMKRFEDIKRNPSIGTKYGVALKEDFYTELGKRTTYFAGIWILGSLLGIILFVGWVIKAFMYYWK